MKRWKKIALALAVLLLLSQTPFIYRRYKLGRLRSTIDGLNSQRADAASADDSYTDLRGVVHVHSSLGGHSDGSLEEIVRAAKQNGLDFVLMTEHPSAHVNTAEATLNGTHDGVLFIGGSEIASANGDRLLIVPGVAPPHASSDTQSIINQAKSAGRLAFVAYPEQLRDWNLRDYDGVEIYNLYTNTKRINYVRLFFDGLWSYRSYPDLLFATFYERPSHNLKRWDELTSSDARRRLVALAGNDAHQNVGLSFEYATGRPLLQIQLDPYERSFRVVRTHVLLEKGQTLDAGALLSSLAQGHAYIAFDLFCDAGGFRFAAESGAEKRIMGDEIARQSGEVRLRVSTPVKSRVLFFRDGQVFQEERDVLTKELVVRESGVYRVEVYLDQLGKPLSEQPWIISNPIYVR